MKTRYATEDVAVDSLEGRGQERSSGGHRSGVGFGEEAGPQVYTGSPGFFFAVPKLSLPLAGTVSFTEELVPTLTFPVVSI